MSVDVEALQGELAVQKKKASDLSADQMRASKEIGALRDELSKLAVIQADNDQLVEEVKDLNSQLKAAKTALDSANKIAEANAALIEAAKQIKAGLSAL